MIKFKNTFPVKLTNTSNDTLCGITSSNFIQLGADHISDTITFYNTYAELAYGYILNGVFTAYNIHGVIISPYIAANEFLNNRSDIQSCDISEMYYITNNNTLIGMPLLSNVNTSGTLNIIENVNNIFGTITSATFILATPMNNNITNVYYFTFDSGDTPSVITWPIGLKWNNNITPIIVANKTYEIKITSLRARYGEY